MIPSSILRIWFLGLLSWLFIGLGIYLGHEWYRHAWSYDFARETSYFDPRLGLNYLTLLLVITLGLVLWVSGGRLIVKEALRLFSSRRASAQRLALETPQPTKTMLSRPDGSTIHVESYGSESAPVILLTHGWGADRTEWDEMKSKLAERFRVITWDLPGLGRSSQPTNHDFSLEKLARDLDAVANLAGQRPIVLLGHSIGGMIVLTFCRLFPQALGSRVAGLALVQTSYTNPVRTTSFAGLLTALERPFLIPLLHLTVGVAPVVWLMNWLSYLNGSSHLSTKGSGFAGTESWSQIEHVTRLGIQAWPAVMARGMLGMLRYDATQTMEAIKVPTLIVQGDRDSVCKPEASDRMHRAIIGSRLVSLKPAKHMGLIEHHQTFTEHVSTFVATCFRCDGRFSQCD
jgi:pimeloyl-ACP methyl ester carboxylesterase